MRSEENTLSRHSLTDICRMKNVFFFLLLVLCACTNKDQPSEAASPEMQLPAPRKVKVESGKATFEDGSSGTSMTTSRVKNDLNGDGEPDRLEVITTKEENDGLGFKRQLVVYSGEGADLDAWYTAEDVILSTEHGGMMGDPLESAKIENGTIVIKHFGGSRTKWNYTHRFRWQDGDFQLISTTIENDDPCVEYTKLDYNLFTDKAEYATTIKKCDGDKSMELETITVNFDARVFFPAMNGFKTGENELKSQGMSEPLYF